MLPLYNRNHFYFLPVPPRTKFETEQSREERCVEIFKGGGRKINDLNDIYT